MNSHRYLDYLIMSYFNQDFDMWGHTIEEIIGCYIDEDNQAHFKGLINDINIILQQDDNSIEEDFLNLYQDDFHPALWNTTAKAFLTFVQEKTTAHLKQHYS